MTVFAADQAEVRRLLRRITDHGDPLEQIAAELVAARRDRDRLQAACDALHEHVVELERVVVGMAEARGAQVEKLRRNRLARYGG